MCGVYFSLSLYLCAFFLLLLINDSRLYVLTALNRVWSFNLIYLMIETGTKCWHFKCARWTNVKIQRGEAKCICTLAAQPELKVCVCAYLYLSLSLCVCVCICSWICLCANKQQAFSNSIKVFFVCVHFSGWLIVFRHRTEWTIEQSCHIAKNFVVVKMCAVQRQKQHEMHLIEWIFNALMSNVERRYSSYRVKRSDVK